MLLRTTLLLPVPVVQSVRPSVALPHADDSGEVSTHACVHACSRMVLGGCRPSVAGRCALLQPLALPGQERAWARRRTGVQPMWASAMPAIRCLACHGLLFLSLYMATYIPCRLSVTVDSVHRLSVAYLDPASF